MMNPVSQFLSWLKGSTTKTEAPEPYFREKMYQICILDPAWINEQVLLLPKFNAEKPFGNLPELTEEAFRETITTCDCPFPDARVIMVETASMDDAIARCRWGTYGKDAKQPLKWTFLRLCTNDHLSAILRTQHHMPPCYREIIAEIFKRRAQAGVVLTD